MSDINKRIAVEVMGWKHDFTEEGKEWGYYNNKVGFYRKYIRHDHFNPSTDYNDASMVVDKMREDGWAMYLTVDPKPT